MNQAAIAISNLTGRSGGTYVTGAGTVTGSFEGIYAHTASVVTIVSAKMLGTLTSVDIPAGSTYLCPCTSVAWVSGKYSVYNSSVA